MLQLANDFNILAGFKGLISFFFSPNLNIAILLLGSALTFT